MLKLRRGSWAMYKILNWWPSISTFLKIIDFCFDTKWEWKYFSDTECKNIINKFLFWAIMILIYFTTAYISFSIMWGFEVHKYYVPPLTLMIMLTGSLSFTITCFIGVLIIARLEIIDTLKTFYNKIVEKINKLNEDFKKLNN